MKKPKLGSGKRFAALKKKLSGKKGIYNPAGLAAAIGRKKYGAKKMASMAAKGRKKKSKKSNPKSKSVYRQMGVAKRTAKPGDLISKMHEKMEKKMAQKKTTKIMI